MILPYRLLFILLPVFLAPAALAISPNPPENISNHVVDLAGVIDPQSRSSLSHTLQELEEKTSVQMVILTVRSLDEQNLEEVSLGLAEKWMIGQKDKNNGILLLVATIDRKYRFEVGYGLEAVLPDSLVGSIARKSLVPYFRKGQYSQGISAATAVIVTTLFQAEQHRLTGSDSVHSSQPLKKNKDYSGLAFIILILLLFVVLVLLEKYGKKKKGKYRTSTIPPIITSGGWSSGGGYGGGFSGGFGGFSGGGGGFGGGGASGGW